MLRSLFGITLQIFLKFAVENILKTTTLTLGANPATAAITTTTLARMLSCFVNTMSAVKICYLDSVHSAFALVTSEKEKI
jgi:hypothetical protein